VFREIDESKFKRDWELGVSVNKISKKHRIPRYVVYYHVGRLGLKPRGMGKSFAKVRGDGSLHVPTRICERLGLSRGEKYGFEVLDEKEKTIKLVKV